MNINTNNDQLTWIDYDVIFYKGKKWLKGKGAIPAKYLFVSDKPSKEDSDINKIFSGPQGQLLFHRLLLCGFDINDKLGCYFTNAVKYTLPGSSDISSEDLKLCKPILEEEIKRVNPEVIICLGSHALKAVVGKNATLSDFRGKLTAIENQNYKVFATYNPSYILRNPEALEAFDNDLKILALIQNNKLSDKPASITYKVLTRPEEVRAFKEKLLEKGNSSTLSIDLEWHGMTWMDSKRYIRTIQMCDDINNDVIIINITKENGVPVLENEEERAKLWLAIKDLLEDPKIYLIGHNIISDGHWLLSYGIDIRNKVVWDSMLAEFLLHETGPFGLEELSLKYTNYGRYWDELNKWKENYSKECRLGFGPVPSEILFPYGAFDVKVPFAAAAKQFPEMEKCNFFIKRGVNQEYPSLWQTTLDTQKNIYELERTGMLVDKERLISLIDSYQSVRSKLYGIVTTEAAMLGLPNFNPASPKMVSDLLFKHLKLPPVKTTKGKDWASTVGNQGLDDTTKHSPSTDQMTLEILENAHPVVKHLLQFRRIDQVCKTWLRYPEEGDDLLSRGGGILSKIWDDGRIHARFSQLAETGRFRTSNPNTQNWSKKAEGYMVEIFGGKDKVPPSIRSIIIPPPGYVLIESDFSQAELFVLAALSGDTNMMEALTTPGKDLHDLTSITAFGFKVYTSDGVQISDDEPVKVARKYGVDSKEFKSFMKSLVYVDSSGRKLTRDEFKDTIRVAGKAINFGLPYGRGPAAIARQIKAETNTPKSLDQLEVELAEMVRVWKEETYPAAWNYLTRCQKSVYDPGYLINPWGRYRRFMLNKVEAYLSNDERDDLERQAGNFNIQSTVADTAMIAMELMVRYRKDHNLHFRLQNQIHDAIIIEAPEDEIDQCITMFKETMGSIDIPVGGVYKTLRLNIDIRVMSRWGEDYKTD